MKNLINCVLLLIILAIYLFYGCRNQVEKTATHIETINNINESINKDSIKAESDTSLSTYINLISQDKLSPNECLRINEVIGHKYSVEEQLFFLNQCYLKDSLDVSLNIALAKAHLLSYYRGGGEKEFISDIKKAEEIVTVTLNFDTKFDNYKEFGLDQKSILKFYNLWNKSNSENRENLLVWFLLEKFDKESKLFKNEISPIW